MFKNYTAHQVLYKALLIYLKLYLFLPTTCSESRFYPIPTQPQLGEDVFLVCELEAPIGEIFDGATPDLRTDDVPSQFIFPDIQQYIIDNRYSGYVKDNSTALKLKGFILIEDLNASDLSRHFYCFQTFGTNGLVNVTITLNDHVNITTSTPACAPTNQTQSTNQHSTYTPETTPNNTESSINSTSNTPTTFEPTNSTQQYSDCTCTDCTVSIVFAVVLAILITLLCVTIAILIFLATLFCSEAFINIFLRCIAKTEEIHSQQGLQTPLANSPSKEEDAVMETPLSGKKVD